MTFSKDEVATVTPELEAACRKLLEGMEVGGPFLPPGITACGCSFPATMAASTGAERRSIPNLDTCSPI